MAEDQQNPVEAAIQDTFAAIRAGKVDLGKFDHLRVIAWKTRDGSLQPVFWPMRLERPPAKAQVAG